MKISSFVKKHCNELEQYELQAVLNICMGALGCSFVLFLTEVIIFFQTSL
jgi:hypothetical protein